MRFFLSLRVILLLGCWLAGGVARAQDDNTAAAIEHQDRINKLLGGLDLKRVKSGFLLDYGIELADVDGFSGLDKDTATRPADPLVWRSLYATLLTAGCNPAAGALPHLDVINGRLDSVRADPATRGTVPLLLLYGRYDRIREDALEKKLVSIGPDSQLVAVPNADPFRSSTLFAASLADATDADGRVAFTFDPAFLVNITTDEVKAVRLDAGDGRAPVTLAPHDTYAAEYDSAGWKTLRITLLGPNAHALAVGTARLYVRRGAATAQRYGTTNSFTYEFPRRFDTRPGYQEPGAPLPRPFAGVAGRAHVTVAYGGTRRLTVSDPQLLAFRKPLIVVEGFDPHKILTSFQTSDWTYEDFINQARNGAIAAQVFVGNQDLNDKFSTADYDLIFVNFEDATDDIRRNAYVVEEVIRWVNLHKAPGAERTVVLGQSMGGLIGRYAVCDLEKIWRATGNSQFDPQVRLLVTQDSPHQGANAPLSAQLMVARFSRLAISQLNYVSLFTASRGLFVESVVPYLRDARRLMVQPATQQMLIASALEPPYSSGGSPYRTFLHGEYRAVVTFGSGVPAPTFQFVALSNGSECGQRQPLGDYGELLRIEAESTTWLPFFNNVSDLAAQLVATLMSGPTAGTSAFLTSSALGILPFTGRNWKSAVVLNALPASGSPTIYHTYQAALLRPAVLVDSGSDLSPRRERGGACLGSASRQRPRWLLRPEPIRQRVGERQRQRIPNC